MPDALVLAGLLLVLAPLVGIVPVAYPPLLRGLARSTREGHIALVGAHRRAWRPAQRRVRHRRRSGWPPAWRRSRSPLRGDPPVAGAVRRARRRLRDGRRAVAPPCSRSEARATPALDDLGVTSAPPGAGRDPARRGDRPACSSRSPWRPGRCSSPSPWCLPCTGTIAAARGLDRRAHRRRGDGLAGAPHRRHGPSRPLPADHSFSASPCSRAGPQPSRPRRELSMFFEPGPSAPPPPPPASA